MHIRLGQLAVLCASVVALAWRFAPQQARFSTIDVEGLRLVDASGSVMASLRSDGHGSVLEMCDHKGKPRLRVSVAFPSKDLGVVSSMTILNDEGETAVQLYQMDGSHGDLKGLDLWRDGTKSLSLGDDVQFDGGQGMVVKDLDGHVSTILCGAGDSQGPALVMSDYGDPAKGPVAQAKLLVGRHDNRRYDSTLVLRHHSDVIEATLGVDVGPSVRVQGESGTDATLAPSRR
jgi:hypothetical protein